MDPWFIVSSAPEQARLIRTAREVNDAKPAWVLDKVADAVNQEDAGTIAILGLAFKPNIDDLRESPALEIAKRVATQFSNKQILAVEPNVKALPPALEGLENVEYATLDSAIKQADVLVLLVDHDEFKEVRTSEIQGKHIVDTKGLWV